MCPKNGLERFYICEGIFRRARDDRRESGGPAVGGREDFDISEKEVGGSQWGCRPVGGAWRERTPRPGWKGEKKDFGDFKKSCIFVRGR